MNTLWECCSFKVWALYVNNLLAQEHNTETIIVLKQHQYYSAKGHVHQADVWRFDIYTLTCFSTLILVGMWTCLTCFSTLILVLRYVSPQSKLSSYPKQLQWYCQHSCRKDCLGNTARQSDINLVSRYIAARVLASLTDPTTVTVFIGCTTWESYNLCV